MTHKPHQDIPNDFPLDWEDCTPLELDDDRWDAFLPDDDQRDPLPEPGDFWIEFDRQEESARELSVF